MTTPRPFVRFRTPVRGYRFAARPPGATHPQAGTRAGLVREREHPLDPFAVAVWIRDAEGRPWRIGYLERAVAARLGPRLDQGQRLSAVVEGWLPEPQGRWRRPLVAIEPEGGTVTAPATPRPAQSLRRVVAQPRKIA